MSEFKPSPNNVPPIAGVASATTGDYVQDESKVVPYVNPTTKRLYVDVNSENAGIGIPEYDYVSMALSAGDTTETYTFKLGGSGGTTVATVVVVYTTSSRDVLSSVTKT